MELEEEAIITAEVEKQAWKDRPRELQDPAIDAPYSAKS